MKIDLLLSGLQEIKQQGITDITIENNCIWIGKTQEYLSTKEVRGDYTDITGFDFYSLYEPYLNITKYGYKYAG